MKRILRKRYETTSSYLRSKGCGTSRRLILLLTGLGNGKLSFTKKAQSLSNEKMARRCERLRELKKSLLPAIAVSLEHELVIILCPYCKQTHTTAPTTSHVTPRPGLISRTAAAGTFTTVFLQHVIPNEMRPAGRRTSFAIYPCFTRSCSRSKRTTDPLGCSSRLTAMEHGYFYKSSSARTTSLVVPKLGICIKYQRKTVAVLLRGDSFPFVVPVSGWTGSSTGVFRSQEAGYDRLNERHWTFEALQVVSDISFKFCAHYRDKSGFTGIFNACHAESQLMSLFCKEELPLPRS